MKILVITGGIGSGKSEVCRILAQKGLTVQYNADAKVKIFGYRIIQPQFSFFV